MPALRASTRSRAGTRVVPLLLLLLGDGTPSGTALGTPPPTTLEPPPLFDAVRDAPWSDRRPRVPQPHQVYLLGWQKSGSTVMAAAIAAGLGGGDEPCLEMQVADKFMMTPLHLACEDGLPEMAAALVEGGARRKRPGVTL